jgi:DNA-binding MarR family transcriptional regulator
MAEEKKSLYVISCTPSEYNEIVKKYGSSLFVPADNKVATIINAYRNQLTVSSLKFLYVLLTDNDYLLYDWKIINVKELSERCGVSAPTGQRAIGDLCVIGAIQRDRSGLRGKMKLYKYSDRIMEILAE